MNYRHQFHAGNFADVFKHLIVARLLKALARKDKGFAYIETHAGAGRYDLRAPDAERTGEYRDGIARLWEASLPPEIAEYIEAVRAVNRTPALRMYPGSPRIARFFMRPQDRMRLCEQAPAQCAQLQAEFADDTQVHVRCGDGYAALKAWLPPPERRGLVLIDPAYERSDEWDRVRDALAAAAKRWPSGMLALWYPIKAAAASERFLAQIAASGLRRLLLAELTLWPGDAPFRLNGCGVLIMNPPWRFDAELRALVETLKTLLEQGPAARARVQWLVPE